MTAAWGGTSLIWALLLAESFLTVGATKRLVLIGPEALRVFRNALFEEELFSLLN